MSFATPALTGPPQRSTKARDNRTFGLQFKRLIEYVLNFLNGSSEMEKNIYAKALQPKAASEALALVKMYENQPQQPQPPQPAPDRFIFDWKQNRNFCVTMKEIGFFEDPRADREGRFCEFALEGSIVVVGYQFE